jgi:hydroxypyruvate reductase
MPARLMTLAISDVPLDNPSVIASGPTVPDPSTLSNARAILERFGIEGGEAVDRILNDPQSETPKPGDPIFQRSTSQLVATPRDSLNAVAAIARAQGYAVLDLGTDLEGEAREVAVHHAEIARQALASGRRLAVLSGGELTVTVKGPGRGGPNQEYALSLAIALNGARGVTALAADTDGTDGGSGSADDPAGAIIDGGTLSRGRDAVAFLEQNDTTSFFETTGDLLQTGPTRTNVNDVRAILVDPSI